VSSYSPKTCWPRHLINLVRGRLITANEIEIAQIDNKWEVVGVDRASDRSCVGSSARTSVST